jgi:hypothetical protein
VSPYLKKVLVAGAVFLSLAFLVILTGQVTQLAEFAERFHPLAGDAVFWGLVFVLALSLLVPAVLVLRLPRPLVPPTVDAGPEFDAHVAKLSARLLQNPRVQHRPLSTLEDVETALTSLDALAVETTKAAGRRAFLVTAVSQSGALDSFVMLGLQARLIWDVAHIYAQRPTVRDMTYLYTNVLGTALVAAELDEAELSLAIQPALSSLLGSASGVVPGLQVASSVFVNSVMSGSANAFLTLRVGIIAQQYSRALVRPEKPSLRRAAALQAAGLLGGIVASGAANVSASIAKATGRTITGAIGGVGRRMRTAGGDVMKHFRREGEEGAGDPEGGPAGGDA